ncbi:MULTISPECIES: crotonase/enoyl-CoA hydratase family protein [Thermocrispum]|jgi:enoyl-CoA hydratase/carnithine racemase|uniref:Crotonase/enoyl-CoA hydratase family protein n=1 Tax=Thermocrispum agreste TaxID=37925 RepID=A0A2W4JTA7_9PSEU|nr:MULTISPECIES: crotonase/enoyl-CoA hydratase family protein [Thermocrispum]PZN01602.1 MAG: crotonase/enoyl-CoA hydratase family protein [Thermocrispum agreste]
MSHRVHTEVKDRIAYVTMTRGEKYNGLDLDMFHALIDAARGLRRDRDVRAVILRGDGPAFSAGLDFKSVGKQPTKFLLNLFRWPWQEANLFQRACWEWRTLPVPVIAVLHGKCYGGGLQLALAADFRFATPDCELSIMEAKWGLIPDMTGSVTLRELVGIDVAKRLTMTGELFDGRTAAGLGLVTGVSEDPLKDAEELAGQIATRSPDAVAYTKKLFHRTRHLSPRAALRLESRLQLRLLRGVNHKIARTAGMAKQVPQYVRRTLS